MSSNDDIQTKAALVANKLASAAVGFAIAALFIAYLQIFLGNITSGIALWKTNQAATGVLASHRSWRFSLRRFKILYPKISLQPEYLFQAAHASKGNWESSLSSCERWRWRTSRLSFSHDRPRATWAQIVQAFRITDASHLVEDYLDSDTIPSGIDVPVQRAKLFDLGRLALYLGCDEVILDVGTRELHAQGEICGMTTDLLPTFGRAVRFEGDTTTLAQMNIGSHRFDTAMIMDCMCGGQFLLTIPIKEFKEFRVHPDILCLSLLQSTSAGQYYAACQSVWPADSVELDYYAGNFADEVETLVAYKNDNIATELRDNFRFGRWQETTRFIRPSIMVISTQCVIPGAFIGYPRSLFLKDLMDWCATEAQQMSKLLIEREMISSSPAASAALQQQCLNPRFFLYHDQVQMPFLGKKPAYSWLTTRLQEEYKDLPNIIKESISSSKPHLHSASNVQVLITPWTMILLEDYRPREWAEKFQRRCQSTSKPYTSPSKLLWTQLILLDISIRLQIKRNPEKLDGAWRTANELRDLDVDKPLHNIMIAEGPEIVQALAQSQINKHSLLGPPSRIPVHHPPRYFSTTKTKLPSYSKCPTYHPWDLHASLRNHCTFYNDMHPDEASKEYDRLAIMLKLRSLLFIAFLMVGPDSSQVFEARHSQAQVPII